MPGADGAIPVDTGFIVYNEVNYPHLVALFRHLRVSMQASEMSFSASIDDGGLEYPGTGALGDYVPRVLHDPPDGRREPHPVP